MASDTGEKRSSRHFEGADEDSENEYQPPAQMTSSSAAYNRENKVTVEHPATAHRKKNEQAPLKKGMCCLRKTFKIASPILMSIVATMKYMKRMKR